MSNEKKKPAKKAPAKKAVAKKTAPAKKAPAKKAPAKKQVAKKAPVKRQTPAVSVVTRQATSATPADITMSVSGAASENTTTHTIINNVVRANDVQTPSLRKRMLRWFTKK
jgi:hypothetical protein